MGTVIQRSLAGGEISPAIWPRADLSKYSSSLRTQRNVITLRHGGGRSRPGTALVAEVKDSTAKVRYISFIFNQSQTYLLEFGNSYFRVHKNGQQLTESGKTITGITAANPAVVTAASHGYSNGDEVVISGVVGMTQVNGLNFKVAGVTTNTFQLQSMQSTNIDSSGYTAYASGGLSSRVYTVATSWTTALIATMDYTQSADVLTLVNPGHVIQEVKRTGDTAWTITSPVYGATVLAPTGLSIAGGSGSGNGSVYWVVPIDDASGEEGTEFNGGGPSTSAATKGDATPASAVNPLTITWTPTAGASTYKIFKFENGVYGFIGLSTVNSFVDDGITPDGSNPLVLGVNAFNATGAYPSAAAYYQQRLCYFNTNNNPRSGFCSQPGLYHNFDSHIPIIDSDAVKFNMAGPQDPIQRVLALAQLIIFTSGAEYSIQGDASGTMTPSTINIKQESSHGAAAIPKPMLVDGNGLFVQARGSVIRDLEFVFQVDGYRGNDLTVFANHLFDGYTMVDWAYQQIPNSIVWVVRSDGILLSMTYLREQQVMAWAHHDFDGTVENVLSIPEGLEDAVYVLVKRTVNGVTKRYIERMTTTLMGNVVDTICMDCSLTYDGRNLSVDTMTVSGGTLWNETELLTLTASAGHFLTSDATNLNQIVLTGSDGSICRFNIRTYSSATVVTGYPDRTVPASLQATATAVWSKAVSHLSGLNNLEGKKLSVFADGYVVGSPNNSAYPVYTVASGAVVLDKPYSVIHAGLPFTADMETLDIDTANGESIMNKMKLVQGVTISTLDTRGVWVGGRNPDTDITNTAADPLFNLSEEKIREYEGYENPVALITDKVSSTIISAYDKNGHVFIRQVDPVPMTIAAIAPAGLFPFKGGG